MMSSHGKSHRHMSILPFAMLALVAAPAQAATTCSVSSPSLAFGSVNVLPGAALDSAATIDVTCDATPAADISYSISLSSGNGGSLAQSRKMTSGSYTIDYDVYADAGRSQVLGDGTSSTVALSDGWTNLSGSDTKHHPIYGRIAANQQSAHIGTYSDALTVTVTYN